jgi:hypothetical protein
MVDNGLIIATDGSRGYSSGSTVPEAELFVAAEPHIASWILSGLTA